MMLLKRQRIPHCPKNNLILRLKQSKGICPVFVRIRYSIHYTVQFVLYLALKQTYPAVSAQTVTGPVFMRRFTFIFLTVQRYLYHCQLYASMMENISVEMHKSVLYIQCTVMKVRHSGSKKVVTEKIK